MTSLSTNELSAATGATLRQLQWWDEKGLLKPRTKVGHKRRYGRSQIRMAKKLKALSYSKRSRELVKLNFAKVLIIDRPTMIGKTLCIPRQLGELTAS